VGLTSSARRGGSKRDAVNAQERGRLRACTVLYGIFKKGWGTRTVTADLTSSRLFARCEAKQNVTPHEMNFEKSEQSTLIESTRAHCHSFFLE